jgi:hypothetical protein
MAGCGGGGGTSSIGVTAALPITLKGTAATGAPITEATITIFDSAGQTVSAATDSNGNYTLDVSTLKPPLLLKLTGQNSDGTPTLLYSAIDSFDGLLNPTANVTPLTNAALVLATGQNASEFFEGPDISKLSKENLAAANAKLKDELGPTIAGSGTDAGVDFAKTSFVADKSGVDLLMESIDIKTNPPSQSNGPTSVALIGKLYKGGKIITPPSGGLSKGNATVVGSLSIPTSYQVANFKGIDSLFAAVNQIIQSGIGNANQITQLTSLTDAAFLNYGQDSQAFWNGIATNGTGAKIVDIGLVGCNFSTPLICEVSGFVASNGHRNAVNTSLIYDGNSNAWKFYGNKRITNLSVTTTLFRETYFTSSTLTRNAYSGYEVVVNTDGGGSKIDTAKLYIFYDNAWQLIDTVVRDYSTTAPNFLYKEVKLSDAQITSLNASALASGVSVRLDLLDASGGLLGSNFLYNVSLPLLSTDVANFKFPEITDSGIAQLKQYNGEKSLTLTVSPGNGVFSVKEFYWNQYFTPGQSVVATDLGLRSKVVNITLENTLAMSDHTNRAFDFYGFTADGMKIHTRNAGCNVAICY